MAIYQMWPIARGRLEFYGHPSEIYKEIAALTPLFAGVTYDGWKLYLAMAGAAEEPTSPLL